MGLPAPLPPPGRSPLGLTKEGAGPPCGVDIVRLVPSECYLERCKVLGCCGDDGICGAYSGRAGKYGCCIEGQWTNAKAINQHWRGAIGQARDAPFRSRTFVSARISPPSTHQTRQLAHMQ